MNGDAAPYRAWTGVRAGLLALLTVVAYLPVVRCAFVWDDDWWVSANPALLGVEGLRAIWLDPASHQQYYPLVPTSFWLEYRIWGLDPLGYHLVNVALHAGSVLLLWTILRHLRVPGAWVAAAIFAVHPVHVESVAWITERKNVLSGFFYVASALAFVRFFRLDGREDEGRAAPGRGAFALACALFLAALLAKTVTATLPAAILLAIWWKRGRIEAREAALVAPLLLVGAAFGSWTAWIERHHVGAGGDVFRMAPIERVLLAGRALWFYAEKLVWPDPLMFVYPRWRIDLGRFSSYIPSVGAAAAVLALWALRRRIGRGPVTGALYFAGTLVPALGFVDVFFMRYSFVADHFQYLASIGPIALLVASGATATARLGPRGRVGGKALAAAVLAALAVLTWRQIGAYRDEEALWRDTLSKNPEAWMAHANLALILARSGRTVEATEHNRAAIRLDPPVNEPRLNLGEILLRIGRAEEAIAVIRDAVRAVPSDPVARYNLGTALGKTGRYEEAVVELREALRLRPGFPEAGRNLATALERMGRLEEAAAAYRDLLARRPGDADLRAGLATVLARQGRTDEAAAERGESLRLRAWALATHRDATRRSGVEAVRLAEQARAALGEFDLRVLDTLAAAHAEAGHFDRATAVAERALARARASSAADLAAEIGERLAGYRRGRPFRDPSTRIDALARPEGPARP